MLSVRIPASLRKRLGRYEVEAESTAQDVVRIALDEFLKKKGE
jgi:hypothetical protein